MVAAGLHWPRAHPEGPPMNQTPECACGSFISINCGFRPIIVTLLVTLLMSLTAALRAADTIGAGYAAPDVCSTVQDRECYIGTVVAQGLGPISAMASTGDGNVLFVEDE